MLDKSDYRQLCRTEPTIPIFSRDWWLDAVCGEAKWDVAMVEKGGEIKGSFPYQIVKRYGRSIITMPKLTQTMGPWVRRSGDKVPHRQSSSEIDTVSELIEALPPFDYFYQNLHHSFTNWLPFFWRDYHQSTRYTYIVPDLRDLDKVHAECNRDVRRQIKQAKEIVDVIPSDDLAKFYALNSMVFERQGLKVPYSLEYVQRLDAACRNKGCRKILNAVDHSGEVHASLYFVWCEESAYALMSGTDTRFRDDGALKLLFWEAINFSQTVTNQFNFTGSMLKPIVRVFGAFGTVQTPYSNITKANGLLSSMLDYATQKSTSLKLARWLERRL
jgi:hypothetical protein